MITVDDTVENEFPVVPAHLRTDEVSDVLVNYGYVVLENNTIPSLVTLRSSFAKRGHRLSDCIIPGAFVTSGTSIREAQRIMDSLQTDVLLVTDAGGLKGVVTCRRIAWKLLGENKSGILLKLKRRILHFARQIMKSWIVNLIGIGIHYRLNTKPRLNRHDKLPGVLNAKNTTSPSAGPLNELEKSKNNFKTLADSISKIYLTLDSDMHITFWGKIVEEISGIPSEKVIGKHLKDLFDSNHSLQINKNVFQRVISTGKPEVVEYYCYEKLFKVYLYPFDGEISVIAFDLSEELQLRNNNLDCFTTNLKNIALEIHNGIGQYISALSIRCEELRRRSDKNAAIAPSELDGLSELCAAAADSIHRLSGSLLPQYEEDITDLEKIRSMCAALSVSYNVTITTGKSADCYLPENNYNKFLVLKFIQEALSNAAKHSGVKTFALVTEQGEDCVRYRIIDQGHGFDTSVTTQRHGIKMMQLNADEIGADFSIESDENGTCVLLEVPEYYFNRKQHDI